MYCYKWSWLTVVELSIDKYLVNLEILVRWTDASYMNWCLDKLTWKLKNGIKSNKQASTTCAWRRCRRSCQRCHPVCLTCWCCRPYCETDHPSRRPQILLYAAASSADRGKFLDIWLVAHLKRENKSCIKINFALWYVLCVYWKSGRYG